MTRIGSTLRFRTGVICLGITTVALWLTLVALAPTALGWSPVVITSGSMTPTIQPGDIVVAAPVDAEQLKAGDVIVFDAAGGATTHRIQTVNADGTYTTRGDANVSTDPEPVHPDEVRGAGRILVPLAGLPRSWLINGQPVLTALALLVLTAAAWLSRYGLLSRYEPRPAPKPQPWLRATDPRPVRPPVGPRVAGLLIAAVGGAAVLGTGGPALAAFGDDVAAAGGWVTTLLDAPTDAHATAGCDGEAVAVTLVWTPGQHPAIDGSRVARSSAGGDPVEIAMLATGVATFTDTQVVEDTAYHYEIRSTAASWASLQAASVDVVTPQCTATASEPSASPAPDTSPEAVVSEEPAPEPSPEPSPESSPAPSPESSAVPSPETQPAP